MNNSDDLVSFDEAEIMASSNPISEYKAYWRTIIKLILTNQFLFSIKY